MTQTTTLRLNRMGYWSLVYGIIMIILGILALLFPYLPSLGLALGIGVVFIVVGVFRWVQVLRTHPLGNKTRTLLRLIEGVLYVIAGIWLLASPIKGTAALTLVAGWLFLAEGIFELVTAITNRNLPNLGWIVLDGLLTIVLGILILVGWPASSFWVLGTLIGISLIFSGWSAVMLGSGLAAGDGEVTITRSPTP
jgi:uncharacterized membrane protein HdeD (DUF308 family)